MKKTVCPRCGAINLEKFVTFPHCAGCAALLVSPRAEERAPHESIWRRPLRAGLWASLVGIALAGAMAMSFSTPEPGEPEQMLIYAQIPRQARMGRVMVCRLGLDSVRSDGRAPGELREVSWTLARGAERDWSVVSVSPSPNSFTRRNGRPAWHYRSWPIESPWSVRLQPRARGRRVLVGAASAAEHLPLPWRTTVTVR